MIWSLPKRVLFRFGFVYWVLYAMPADGRSSILSYVPGADWAMQPWTKLWHAICPWIAIHIFHLTGERTTYFLTGSGDTTLGYIENLAFLALAAVAAVVWSATDWRGTEYRALNAWLRTLLRYTLAFTLFAYGFAKVFPLQFQPPHGLKLLEPYGEFSPMGALWSFMGASAGYTIFAGASETLGGLLLLFRRTTTLGALVSFGVMANVVALNFFYDVPVKLYSTNLLIMAAFLAAGDTRRLLNVFLLNRPSEAVELEPPKFASQRLRIASMALWTVVVGYVLFEHVSGGWAGYKQAYLTPVSTPISGLYDVAAFSIDGRQPIGAPAPWSKVDFTPQGVAVRRTDGNITRYAVNYMPDKLLLNKTYTLTWSRPDASRVVLRGMLDAGEVSVELRALDATRFLLLNRGFHWINERPFNR